LNEPFKARRKKQETVKGMIGRYVKSERELKDLRLENISLSIELKELKATCIEH